MNDFARADSALDAVLDDTPTGDAPTAESAVDDRADRDAGQDPDEGRDDLDEAGALDLPAASSEVASEDDWLCDADEAREMVDRARAAIDELDASLRQIIQRRAWEPLGYADPKEFVLAELGPSAPGGKSRAQAYRLARLAMFLYGLAEAFGEDSSLLDISERQLRALPPGAGGENDEVLTERVASRIDALDEPTEETAREVFDEEYQRAQDEIAKTGRLARSDEPAVDDDPGHWDDVTSDEYEEDTFSTSDITGDGDQEGDEARPEWETQSTSRMDYVDAHGAGETASDATLTYVHALREVMSALAVLTEQSQHLPDIVEYASDEEITTAAAAAAATADMTSAFLAAAEERDDTFAL